MDCSGGHCLWSILYKIWCVVIRNPPDGVVYLWTSALSWYVWFNMINSLPFLFVKYKASMALFSCKNSCIFMVCFLCSRHAWPGSDWASRKRISYAQANLSLYTWCHLSPDASVLGCWPRQETNIWIFEPLPGRLHCYFWTSIPWSYWLNILPSLLLCKLLTIRALRTIILLSFTLIVCALHAHVFGVMKPKYFLTEGVQLLFSCVQRRIYCELSLGSPALHFTEFDFDLYGLKK